MEISAKALSGAIVISLYFCVGLFAIRRPLPRLSSSFRRLAWLLLAAQATVIGITFFVVPSTSFQEWLWNLDNEWNIPATLASIQLALVGVIALFTAVSGGAGPLRNRLYFAGVGLVFLYLAFDEYALIHEYITHWSRLYVGLGAAVVLATLAMAATSPKGRIMWYALLVSGLALSASGGILFEFRCADPVFAVIGNCAQKHLLEESLEFLGIWLALAAMMGCFTEFSPMPGVVMRRAIYAVPALWLLLLVLSPAISPIDVFNVGAKTAAVEYEADVRLHGYLLEKNQRHLHLFISAGRWDYFGQGLAGLGYSIQLVDQASGSSVLGRDAYTHRRFFQLAPDYVPVYRQWLDIGATRELPPNRAYWIVLSLWRADGDDYQRQRILTSDRQLLNDSQLVLGELVLRAKTPAVQRSDSLAAFDNGFALDAAEMPARARAGETLAIKFSWRAEEAGVEELTQFLHLNHVERDEWWAHDQPPLGRRLPTRLWYSGLADSETWLVPLPPDLRTGRYRVSTGLYRARDQARLPAAGADGNALPDARVMLGELVIE